MLLDEDASLRHQAGAVLHGTHGGELNRSTRAANKQTSKQTNDKQTNKQANQQTTKQTDR
jgi:hypothetical protein